MMCNLLVRVCCSLQAVHTIVSVAKFTGVVYIWTTVQRYFLEDKKEPDQGSRVGPAVRIRLEFNYFELTNNQGAVMDKGCIEQVLCSSQYVFLCLSL